jgi:hypothetical protein
MRRSTLIWIATALSLAVANVPALAVTRSVYISPATMGVWPVYRADILNPMLLSDTSDSTFRVGFLLPADYIADTTVKLKLHLQAVQECSIVFGVRYLDRTRPGSPVYETSPPSLDGMTNGNTAIVDLPAQNVVVMNFDIVAPAQAPFVGQKKGDGILIWFERVKRNALDTCGIVTLWQAEIRYEST